MSSSDDHILNDNEATRTPLFMLKTTFCYEWMSVASQTFQIFSQLQSNFPMLILVPHGHSISTLIQQSSVNKLFCTIFGVFPELHSEKHSQINNIYILQYSALLLKSELFAHVMNACSFMVAQRLCGTLSGCFSECNSGKTPKIVQNNLLTELC
jgi:hypothetical protein